MLAAADDLHEALPKWKLDGVTSTPSLSCENTKIHHRAHRESANNAHIRSCYAEAMNTWPLRHSARTLAFPKLQNLTALPLVRCRPRFFTTTRLRLNDDARLRELGREIEDDYATIRDNYGKPSSYFSLESSR